MEEYKIDENTTYIDDGSSQIIKYAKQDGSSLVVEFWEDKEGVCNYSSGGDVDHYTTQNIIADVYILKPIKVEENQTEEKKLSKFEKAKNRLLQKFLSKKEDKKEKNKAAPKETFSKEVLFTSKIYPHSSSLEIFLANPIELEPEYKSILKVLESARQTIITDGYRLKEEATKVYLQQLEAKTAEEEKAASAERIAKDKHVASKLKGLGIER